MRTFSFNHRLVAFVVIFISGVLASCDRSSQRYSQVAPRHTPEPRVVVVGDPMLNYIAGKMWGTEVERRFPNAIVMLCHGQDINHEFYCFPGGTLPSGILVSQEMDILRAEYPDRPIVVLACNPEHIAIHGHPNCYYSTSETWVIPDRDVMDEGVQAFVTAKLPGAIIIHPHTADEGPVAPHLVSRWVDSPDVTGNVFELISAE